MQTIEIGIIMGSDSDMSVMMGACDILTEFGIGYETKIVSAHRTPEYMFDYAKHARSRGIKLIIAGAGGAAHLPGILSILQMPNGVPVATVALNGAKNAGILAAQIISIGNKNVETKLDSYKSQMRDTVLAKNE